MAASEVLEVVQLPPRARTVASLGHAHSLESALADIVDNAIDANATKVTVRFLQEHSMTVALEIQDNGDGMDPISMREAMRLGSERHYSASALGHFGVGLKVASLSQAEELVVASRKAGSQYCGARIKSHSFEQDYSVDILTSAFAASLLASTRNWNAGDSGTIVEWRTMRAVSSNETPKRHEQWLHDQVNSAAVHFGIVYHRLLARGLVSIDIEIVDRSTRAGGVPRAVVPIDPFKYRSSGDPAFPLVLQANLGTHSFALGAHILPAHGESANFRLLGKPGSTWQGIYFYRNNRLVQIGGWGHIEQSRPDLQLARVEIDVDQRWMAHIGMSAEKNSISLTPAFEAAIRSSRDSDGGLTFANYISRARQTYASSKSRGYSRQPLFALGTGFDVDIAATLEAEVGSRAGELPVNIRWKRMLTNDVFEIDRDNMTILLNDQYRPVLAPAIPGAASGENDAPVVKVLVFLLAQDLFAGARLGPKERDEIEVWNHVLRVAADKIVSDTHGGVYGE